MGMAWHAFLKLLLRGRHEKGTPTLPFSISLSPSIRLSRTRNSPHSLSPPSLHLSPSPLFLSLSLYLSIYLLIHLTNFPRSPIYLPQHCLRLSLSIAASVFPSHKRTPTLACTHARFLSPSLSHFLRRGRRPWELGAHKKVLYNALPQKVF